MPKNKPIYVCTDCGYESAKWMGRCPSCGAWNKMEEQAPAAPAPAAGPARKSTVLTPAAPAKTLLEIEESEQERVHSGIGEFDRVLGGGIVPGSLVLIGGDIRPHVVDALQALVGTIKNECVSEVEREA